MVKKTEYWNGKIEANNESLQSTVVVKEDIEKDVKHIFGMYFSPTLKYCNALCVECCIRVNLYWLISFRTCSG